MAGLTGDPFLKSIARPRVEHAGRAHSKFSASGSERWMNCSGSVKLNEGIVSKSSIWAKEGEEAHEVLEKMLKILLDPRGGDIFAVPARDDQMWDHGSKAASFIRALVKKNPHAEALIETRIYLDFIHPEMFGTFDSAVVDHFGTLHIFDYKYGVGPVSPVRNLQLIFYGMGLAYRYNWNFKRVKLWIIQPRIKGYEGPLFWEVPILELKEKWVPEFEKGVERVERFPNKLAEGSWCHWCGAKSICPLKKDSKNKKAALVFGAKVE